MGGEIDSSIRDIDLPALDIDSPGVKVDSSAVKISSLQFDAICACKFGYRERWIGRIHVHSMRVLLFMANRPHNILPICVPPRPMFSIHDISTRTNFPDHESISTVHESISQTMNQFSRLRINFHCWRINFPAHESFLACWRINSPESESIISKANQFFRKGVGQRINASTKQFQRLQTLRA